MKEVVKWQTLQRRSETHFDDPSLFKVKSCTLKFTWDFIFENKFDWNQPYFKIKAQIIELMFHVIENMNSFREIQTHRK